MISSRCTLLLCHSTATKATDRSPPPPLFRSMLLSRLRRTWKLPRCPRTLNSLPPPSSTKPTSCRSIITLFAPTTSLPGSADKVTPKNRFPPLPIAAANKSEQAYHPHTTDDDDDDGQIEDDGEEWEEEEEEEEGAKVEPKIGDGGDGGGVALRGVGWGERALAIAHQVLDKNFDTQDMSIFSFKVSPNGYVYVRLDKHSHRYGCPDIDEIQRFNLLYKDQLEESGKLGEIPNNLAIEVSSPGALRLLKVPDELERFKDIPLVVNYLEEDPESNVPKEKEGVFFLDSIDNTEKHATWKLADVKENKSPSSKGRPLSKKRKEWRLTLPFDLIKRVTFYLSL